MSLVGEVWQSDLKEVQVSVVRLRIGAKGML
jgi:hypothetical protein